MLTTAMLTKAKLTTSMHQPVVRLKFSLEFPIPHLAFVAHLELVARVEVFPTDWALIPAHRTV